jgi:hypothetical protein
MGEKILGDVIPFPGRRSPHRPVDMAPLHKGMFQSISADLRIAQLSLKQAETNGWRAVRYFSDQQIALRRALEFCARCDSAIESNDLDVMIRTRNVLQRELSGG